VDGAGSSAAWRSSRAGSFSIKVVGGFAKSIPDMKFDIKEVMSPGIVSSYAVSRELLDK